MTDQTPAHSCDNCDGVDPDSCLANPARPAPVPPPDGVRAQIAAALRTTPATGHSRKPGEEKWDHHPAPGERGHTYTYTCALCRADVDALADAVLRVPAIAEALAGIPLVCSDERHQAKIQQQRTLIEIWQEQARHVTTRADKAEATVARVRHALMNQSYLTSLDETIAAALDPQEQP